MPSFPENEIELIPPFLVEEPAFDWAAMAKALRHIHRSAPVAPDPDDERATRGIELMRDTIEQRQRLAAVLERAPLVVEDVKKLWEILRVPEVPSLPPMDALEPESTGRASIDLRIALRSTALELNIRFMPDEGGRPITQHHVLRPYQGPAPGEAGEKQISQWAALLGNLRAQNFCFGVLKMEAHAALRNWKESVRIGDELLTAEPAGSASRKFIALKLARGHSALGDRAFRARRVLDTTARAEALTEYETATRLLDAEGLSSENPRRQEVDAHVALQRAKLEAGLNYLGFYESFVPVQTFDMLDKASQEQVTRAKKAAVDLQSLLLELDQAVDTQLKSNLDLEEAQLNQQIIKNQRLSATLRVEQIDSQLASIDVQRDKLNDVVNSLPTVASAVLQAAVTGISVGGASTGAGVLLGLAQGGLGTSAVIMNSSAQKEQLEQQRKLAEVDRRIAQINAHISQLEMAASTARLSFLEDKLERVVNGRANADFILALADVTRKRALRLLDAAILVSYLAERALAFMLGKPHVQHIQFNYLDDLGKPLIEAVNKLDDDRANLALELVALDQELIDDFIETISLRKSYPLQFQQLQQTGEMVFTYTLHQLSQTRPGSHQCRLYATAVEVIGLLPSTGFSGNLIHSGRFVVRDLASTLDPETVRFVPTIQQVEQAVAEQRERGGGVASVGGVMYYEMDKDTKELSESRALVARPGNELTRELLKGRAPTGDWRLIIRRHSELSITDVLIHFGLVARESQPDTLEPKVKQLLRSYEAELMAGDSLDTVSVFSLRQSFSDAFEALARRRAEFTLTEENFPDGISSLELKTVIVQTLDDNGRGIAGVDVAIQKAQSSTRFAQVTREDGLGANLDEPLPILSRGERLPMLGTWQIELTRLEDFGRVDDIRVFFLYSFEPVSAQRA
jgi:hypothetical protein